MSAFIRVVSIDDNDPVNASPDSNPVDDITNFTVVVAFAVNGYPTARIRIDCRLANGDTDSTWVNTATSPQSVSCSAHPTSCLLLTAHLVDSLGNYMCNADGSYLVTPGN